MKLIKKAGLGFLSLGFLSASALAYDLAQDVKVNLPGTASQIRIRERG